jgi:uncharacterized protein
MATSEVPTHRGTEPLEGANTEVPTPTIADPGPLGLAGFAMTTFVLSCLNAGWFGGGQNVAVVLGLAAFYGGLAQLLAGMWEFRKGNTFGALAFSSFGAFWLSYFFLVRFEITSIPASQVETAVGLYLLAWTIFTAYMTIAALRVSGAVLLVFVLLTVTFVLLTIGALGTSTEATKIGGYLGILTALAAWYASFAGVTNATFRRNVLPTWPLG